MQQRDQPRAAFVDEAEFLGDPGADLARRARQGRPDPGLQGVALLGAHLARTAAHLEAGQAFDAVLFEKLVPVADRVVVEQQNLGHFLAAQAFIQPHQRSGAPRHPTSRQTIARQRDQRLAILFNEKAASNHRPSESAVASNASFFRLSNESGYNREKSREYCGIGLFRRKSVKKYLRFQQPADQSPVRENRETIHGQPGINYAISTGTGNLAP